MDHPRRNNNNKKKEEEKKVLRYSVSQANEEPSPTTRNNSNSLFCKVQVSYIKKKGKGKKRQKKFSLLFWDFENKYQRGKSKKSKKNSPLSSLRDIGAAAGEI